MLGKAHSVGGGENEVRRVGPQFPFLKNGYRSEAPGQTGDIEVPQSPFTMGGPSGTLDPRYQVETGQLGEGLPEEAGWAFPSPTTLCQSQPQQLLQLYLR